MRTDADDLPRVCDPAMKVLLGHTVTVAEPHAFVVTDRGRAIARVVPIGTERVLDRLIAEGTVTARSKTEAASRKADQDQGHGLGPGR
jgi:hypothetical protein